LFLPDSSVEAYLLIQVTTISIVAPEAGAPVGGCSRTPLLSAKTREKHNSDMRTVIHHRRHGAPPRNLLSHSP
jgi:hypothetical protein